MRPQLFTPRRPSIGGAALAHEGDLSALGSRAREAAALVIMAAAIYLALALAGVRLDPTDPALKGPEYVGPVGSAIASVLVRGFGVVAWFGPVELVVVGLPLLRRSSRPMNALRLSGDLLVCIILSALARIALPVATVFGKMPIGGNVGLLFGELMQALFSTAGSFLVGLTVVGLILIGRSTFSFIQCVNAAQRGATRLGRFLGDVAHRGGSAWREARALRRERAEAQEAAEAPHIETKPSDEAILAHLDDDDSDWLEIERTGAPPLALSQALRDSMARRTGVLDAALTGTEQSAVSASADTSGAPEQKDALSLSAPKRTPVAAASVEASKTERAREGQAKPGRARAPAEPKIVDTRPQQQVVRSQRRDPKTKEGFKLPPTELLQAAPPLVGQMDRERILEQAGRLEKTLADYGVTGKVAEIHPGPTVTTYEITPEAGTKVSRIANLSDDLALGLSRKVRIIAPIPGKSRVGFELPNDERIPVSLRELVEDKRFDALAAKAPLPVVLGRDIVGAPFYADLASMPHVIVAGATGAGKSVGINVMLSSLLFRRAPDELRFLMIDPKVVELAPFDGIPHMLLPVVTDMKQAATALKWAVDEMERRYQLFANAGTKNITTYNRWVERIAAGEIPPPDPMDVSAVAADGSVVSVPATKAGSDGVCLPGKLPYIVIVVDEFADLMMQQGKDVEASVARLAQKARAAGMHVVLATQRPSVDVITGMIKANFPTRIGFRVAQKVDSRTILDEQGAELLLGKGDMLVKMNGSNDTRRVQCPFVSEEEVNALTDYLRAQGTPQYHDDILKPQEDEEAEEMDEALDPRFDEAVRIVAETQRCSTSWLQRKMTIGYNRAAKIVEMMERRGMVGPPNGARDREVLLPPP